MSKDPKSRGNLLTQTKSNIIIAQQLEAVLLMKIQNSMSQGLDIKMEHFLLIRIINKKAKMRYFLTGNIEGKPKLLTSVKRV